MNYDARAPGYTLYKGYKYAAVEQNMNLTPTLFVGIIIYYTHNLM